MKTVKVMVIFKTKTISSSQIRCTRPIKTTIATYIARSIHYIVLQVSIEIIEDG